MASIIINSSHWPKVAFGDVVRNVDESVRDPQNSGLERYVGLEHIDPESLHIQRWGLISEGTSFTRRFRKGQVLFGKRRAYQRKIAIAEFDGLCSSDILVFEPKDDRLLPELLPFICQSDGFFEHALDTSAGSLSPRTKFKELARYEFPLPPLDEQRRIAQILWAADETIQGFVTVLNNLGDLQNSARETIFYKSGYKSKPIKELASIRYGLGQPPSLKEDGVRMIRATDISKGEINESRIIRVDLNEVPNGRAILLDDGDIIIVRSGAYTGDSAMITREFVGSIAGYDLVIHPNPQKIIPYFLAEFLLHKRTVEKIIKPLSIRSAQPHLNVNDVGNIDISIPDLENQEFFTSKLSNIHKQIITTKKHLSKLRNQFILLREGLLKNSRK
jgi:type I restriction enzyme S subunit